MTAAWLVVLLIVLMPGAAAGQFTIVPPRTDPNAPIILNPRTPPPTTIPSAPELSPELNTDLSRELRLPGAPPIALRPTKPFELHPTFTLSEEYSDNFDRVKQNPISNFRTSVMPGLEVLLDSGLLTGQASYRLTGFHDSSANDFGTQHAFAGAIAWQATPRLRLTAADAFVQSDDPGQADRLNVSNRRRDFTRNLLSLGAEYTLGTIETRGYYLLSIFDSSERTTSHTIGATGSLPIATIHLLTVGVEYLDTETTGGGRATSSSNGGDSATTGYQLTGSFSREINPEHTVGIQVTWAAREQTTVSRGTEDFTRWNVSLFNTYVLPGTIVMRGSIGVAQQQSDSSNGRLLPTSNSSLLYFLGPAVLGLTVESGFSDTFATGENSGVVETQAITGSVSYRFSPLLSALVRASYRENEFTDEGGGADAGRKDKVTIGAVRITYLVFDWLTATFDYTYTNSKSNDVGNAFTENRVRAALNARF